MAGFFQNLRLVAEGDRVVAGEAYSTATDTPTNELLANASANTTANIEQGSNNTAPNIHVQTPLIGFGSYLDGILPSDIATACGAFATSMLQIKNIKNVPIEKFAQVVTNIETTSGLTINGTSVPTDTILAGQGLPLIAKGSGPFGTYTMSDFYGCMSGLPYIGLDIDGLIKNLETATLYNIYKQLYLAVTWEPASVTVNTSYDSFSGIYTVVSVVLANDGGGYGREGLPATITLSNGATGTMTIGTDDTNLGTFGRVQSLPTGSLVGTTSSSPITVTVINPQGLGAFPDSIVQDYIDDANAEILNIGLAKNDIAAQMNTNWSFSGRKLSIEQEAITIGSQVSIPSDATKDEPITNLAQYPTTQISFTDLIPVYGLQTQPHMQSQTLEAIANLSTIGGQSIVGLMREARNQNRLTEIGISLDNTIDDTLTSTQNKQLIANGTLDGTQPAVLGQVIASFDAEGNITATANVYPNPYGTYNNTNNNYYVTNPDYNGTQLGTVVDTGAAVVYTSGAGVSGDGTNIPAPIIGFPGSFAGSRYSNLIPASLNAFYTSNTLLPSTYTVNQAIEDVIRCNCDCWDMIN